MLPYFPATETTAALMARLGAPGAEIMLDGMTGFLEQIAVGCPDDTEAYDEDIHCEIDYGTLFILDFFPEYEHLVIHTPVTFLLFRNGGPVLMLVPELNDMEAAAVHVEVDVALL